MIGRILPRYLILAATLTLVVVGLMLSLFYGQYQRLATDIVSSSVKEHDAILEGRFEGRARAQLHRIADSVAATANQDDSASISLLLEKSTLQNETLSGVRYVRRDLPNLQVRSVPERAGHLSTQCTTFNLYLPYPITIDCTLLPVLLINCTLFELPP